MLLPLQTFIEHVLGIIEDLLVDVVVDLGTPILRHIDSGYLAKYIFRQVVIHYFVGHTMVLEIEPGRLLWLPRLVERGPVLAAAWGGVVGGRNVQLVAGGFGGQKVLPGGFPYQSEFAFDIFFVVEVDKCSYGLLIAFDALLHPLVDLDQFLVLPIQFHGHNLARFGTVVAVFCQPLNIDDFPFLYLLLLLVPHLHLPLEAHLAHSVTAEVLTELAG